MFELFLILLDTGRIDETSGCDKMPRHGSSRWFFLNPM